MKTLGVSRKKSDKPFLAARIPVGLSNALEAHVKSTQESKTDVIINALSTYLGWADNGSTQPSASDRLSKLEARLNELEKLVREPRQTSLLDNLEQPKASDSKVYHKPQPVIEKDNSSDNKTKSRKLLSNREMSELSGVNYETVRSRHKADKLMTIQDSSYKPLKRGSSCLWEPN